MTPGKRILVNTAAQYSRTLVNTCLSLYTVRLILQILGQDDYGIYSLISGIVAMILTTQRHLSYSYGQYDESSVRKTFANSVLLHFGLSLVLVLLMLSVRNVLFGYLTIPFERHETALTVYVLAVAMLFVTFNTSPFKALLIARENIVFISLIEICDGFLKLFFAIVLYHLDSDKLFVYSVMMLLVYCTQFAAFTIYSVIKFKECCPGRFFLDYDGSYMKRLLGFAGWTTFGTATIVFRNQGLAVLINHFIGTIANAAYGIAQQVYGNVAFLAGSILNAMNPQMMKAEGAGNHSRMLLLAQKESKIILTILSLLFIPMMQEMMPLLHAWLGAKEVSPYTPLLCQFMLGSLLLDQSTYGLHTAVQAMGKIRDYTLLIYTPKILLIFAMWGAFKLGFGLQGAMLIYIIVETIVAILRIPYAYFRCNLNVKGYLHDVFGRMFPLLIFLFTISWGIQQLSSHPLRFIVNILITAFFGVLMAWFYVLNKEERSGLKKLLKRNY